MDKQELIRQAMEALKRFHELPYEEQWRRLVARGTINEEGEVLMGLEEARKLEANGDGQAPPPPEGPPPAKPTP